MKLFKKNKPENSNSTEISRRTFLEKLGLGGVLIGLAGFGFQSFKTLIPNVRYEPAKKFKIGFPNTFTEGITYLKEQRLYVLKNGKSFHCISAVCTHLGCTVKYVNLNQPKKVEIEGTTKEIHSEFHCPCHGSKFYEDGTNFAGPAPKPLKWYKMEISPDDGQLVINMNEESDRSVTLTV